MDGDSANCHCDAVTQAEAFANCHCERAPQREAILTWDRLPDFVEVSTPPRGIGLRRRERNRGAPRNDKVARIAWSPSAPGDDDSTGASTFEPATGRRLQNAAVSSSDQHHLLHGGEIPRREAVEVDAAGETACVECHRVRPCGHHAVHECRNPSSENIIHRKRCVADR